MKDKLLFLKPMPHIAQFNCCFRELLDLWEERGYCDLEYITQIETQNYTDSTVIPEARVWIEKIGNILCYDNTRLDKYCQNFKFALFGNEVLHAPNTSPWIFWSRHPRHYEEFQLANKPLSFEERKIKSIFIGNMTTNKRVGDWKQYIEFWRMGNRLQHLEGNMTFPYPEYLKKNSQAKYGLCLPGQGPKCLREIELMGLGVVPLFTSEISLDYYDPPQELEHFFLVKKPEDIAEVVESTSEAEWKYMSNACITWYNKNCSVEGSFKTTIEILEKNGAI